MKARGPKDQVVEVRRKTRTPDGSGGFSESEATQYTLRANVRATRGTERAQFAGSQAVQEAVFTFHAKEAALLETTDTLLWNSVRYNIRSLPPIGREHDVELIAEAGVTP